MKLKRELFLKIALCVVATSFLLYTIYQSITTTVFIANFQTVIVVIPQFVSSSQPALQLGLFLFQEIAGSIGSYLRLIGAVLAVSCAALYFRNNAKYLGRLRLVFLFESFYFLLLLPSAINHLAGSVISTSDFLNFYTGVSTLLQGVLVFPPLFMLSRKLKNQQNYQEVKKYAILAAPLYVFGFWVRHGFLWVYALSSSAPLQAGSFEFVGFLDSWMTLLVAGIVTTFACFAFKQKKKFNQTLAAAAITLVGLYFVIYDLVSLWLPVYRAFIPLTDFWMVTLPLLGVALLFPVDTSRNQMATTFDVLKGKALTLNGD